MNPQMGFNDSCSQEYNAVCERFSNIIPREVKMTDDHRQMVLDYWVPGSLVADYEYSIRMEAQMAAKFWLAYNLFKLKNK